MRFTTRTGEKILTRILKPIGKENISEERRRYISLHSDKLLYAMQEQEAALMKEEVMPQLPFPAEIIETIPLDTSASGKILSGGEEVAVVGAATQVYRLKPKGQDTLVAKVERQYQDEDRNTHTPWQQFGLRLSERKALTRDNAETRKEVHLSVQKRLEEKGIKTVAYKGSFYVPGYDKKTQLTIDALGFKRAKEELGSELQEVPMYLEVWDDPGGIELSDAREEEIEELYMSPESREQLKTIAKGLIGLGQEGFTFDVCYAEEYIGGTEETVPLTAEKGYPFPKNFMLDTHDNLVAFDFNLGVDLKEAGLWDEELLSKYKDGILYQSKVDQKMYVNSYFIEELKEKLAVQKEASLQEIADQYDEADEEKTESVIEAYTQERVYWARVEYEVERLSAQVALGVSMLKKIEEIENKD